MGRPASFTTSRSHRRVTAAFVLAELVLALAVPFLAIAGYHALLDSQAGRFVEAPTENQPGWRALVEPTPVVAVAEVAGGRLTGIALIATHAVDDQAPGTVILAPGTLRIDGATLDRSAPADAVATLAAALRLRMSAVEIVDAARWAAVLGERTWLIDNPDPVVDDAGAPLLMVGPVAVGAANIEPFLSRPAPGADPVSLVYRRQLFWEALLADPPSGADPLTNWLALAAGDGARVVELPRVDLGSGAVLDRDRAEQLIREVVPVPAGTVPGERTQVRVLDRTGTTDLASVAALVAGTGLEVIEIGNAPEFDGGSTALVVPSAVADPGVNELAALTGAATVEDVDSEAGQVVTLLVGSDFALTTESGALN